MLRNIMKFKFLSPFTQYYKITKQLNENDIHMKYS